MDFSPQEHPRESINWRRYRSGCPYYRVRWFIESDPDAGEPMYQVFCLQNTPAETWEEQEKCLASRTQCWRVTEAQRAPIPISSITRRATGATKAPVN